LAAENGCDSNGKRKDCGFDGVTKETCEASYCCWSPVLPNPNSIPWCFYPTQLDSEVEREFDGGETAAEDADWHFNAGKKKLLHKDFGHAYEHFDEAIKLNPNHVDAIHHLGILHHERGKFQFAIMAYQHALSLEQDTEKMGLYLHRMALAFAAQNNWKDAQGAFGEALQVRPRDATIYNTFARELEKRNMLAKSSKAYSNAISLDPSNAVSYIENAAVLTK
jgi:tetratricopeptide (TPR) repeat protein